MKLNQLNNDTLIESKKLAKILRKTLAKYWGINPREKKSTDINSYRSMKSDPSLHLQPTKDSSRGIDPGSRISGYTYMSTGIPQKQRHRKYMGIKPPGGAF